MIKTLPSAARSSICLLAAILLHPHLASAQEISVVDDTTNTPLSDGQAGVVDFGCTKPGVPVARTFTVTNSDATDLVLVENGLSLPAGYILNPPWPTAEVTPEFLFEVNAEGGGVVTGNEFKLRVVNAPSFISVTSVSLTIPLDPAGSTPPAVQLPYVDSDGVSLVSTTGTSPGIDTDPVSAPSNWLCPAPGQPNPNGDICFEFANQIFPGGPANRLDRHRTFIARVAPGKLTGSLANPASNGILQYGVSVEQMNPPAIPGGGDNGDGDNYGIGGIDVTITVFNSLTNTTQTITGELVDDGIDNDTSQVTLYSDPVEVPVPVFLGQNESFQLTVELNSATEGVFGGSWSLANNDAGENPFDFPITGIVDGTAPTINNLPGNLSFASVDCKATVSWTAPAASDILDPAPTIIQTSGPASGSEAVVGVYRIEYTATDCAGNSVTEGFNVSVTDTTPPTLVGACGNIIRNIAPGETSGIITYPPLTAFDDCDPNPTVICTPPSGSVFPLGLTEVCCVAVDSSGNMSAEICFDVLVLEQQPVGSERYLEGVGVRGTAATGGSILPAAKILTINNAFLNNAGDVAFDATISGNGTANNTALFLRPAGGAATALAVKGEAFASPLGSGSYGAFSNIAVNNAGDVGFQTLASSSRPAHFVDTGSGPAASAVRSGPVPSLVSGETYSGLYLPALASNGELLTPASLTLGGLVTASNDTAITSSAGGVLVREGDAEPGGLPSTLIGQLLHRIVTGNSGTRYAFPCFLAETPQDQTDNLAIYTGALGGPAPSIAVRKGQAAAGTPGAFDSFIGESINSFGAIALRAWVAGGGVTAADNEGIWVKPDGATPPVLVAREGDVVPCIGGGLVAFAGFKTIYMGDDGAVHFLAYLKNATAVPAVSTANDTSVWVWKNGELDIVVREGDMANNTDGCVIARIAGFDCSNAGGIVYSVDFVPGVGGATSLTNQAVYVDRGGADPAPLLVLRRGDKFDEGGAEKTVSALWIKAIQTASGSTGGYGRTINDSGEALVLVSFTSSGYGMFVVGTPPPGP